MRILTLLLLSSALAAQSGTTKSFDVEAFDELYGSYAINIELVRGSDYSVEVTTRRAGDMDDVVVESENGRLTVKMRDGRRYDNVKVSMRITTPSIKTLYLSGATSTAMRGFTDLGTLDIKLSGASQLDIKDGSARELNIHLAGASRLDADDFTAEVCEVLAAGASNARLRATERLTGKLSGASNLHYEGKPKNVDLSTSGASRYGGN